MSAIGLQELNQRYVRLTDRSRSQWTFYQYLQGLFKHLFNMPCPIEIDFPTLFNELRQLGAGLGHSETGHTERTISGLNTRLDGQARRLLEVDEQIPPSLLRRFFDRLRNQDEKVLLAIIKFYLDASHEKGDTLDKLDILFTRLAEIPREDHGSLARERHEIERLVHPLLQYRPSPKTSPQEVDALLQAIAELRGEVLGCRNFTELVAGGALDRFRGLKRRLGENMLHPSLLPVVLETTVSIKNRFRELWEDEEAALLNDTNRVRELQKQLAENPEIATPELRELLEVFAAAQQRFDEGRQTENVRREDALKLRQALNRILEQFDITQLAAPLAPAAEEADQVPTPWETGKPTPPTGFPGGGQTLSAGLQADPLLQEYVSKILFALELVGSDRPADEAVTAKELAHLRLEACEVKACRALLNGSAVQGSLVGERARHLLQAAALRIRLDDEAREIDRLQKRSSEHLSETLERASQSLQRAAELDRRFGWLVEDALYRGDTEHLEELYRCRFRLLRAYSGLWLIHNERGGISPY
ncbi:MAG TPA: hypothetical protein VMT45_00495 [Thermoanaerobaculaceae bacterium]|nr:hypothetical protein [Thermoanaerobaculaceae bacterium]